MRLTEGTIHLLCLVLIVMGVVAPLDSDANPMSPQVVTPTLTRVEPDNDTITGGATVQIIGENFQDGATVTIGGNAVSNVIFVSPTELMVEVPAGSAGSTDVVVTNPDGNSDTLVDGFTYTPESSPYDVTQDGAINILDLVRTASQLGETGEGLSGDVNEDGVVNILDLVAVANQFSQG